MKKGQYVKISHLKPVRKVLIFIFFRVNQQSNHLHSKWLLSWKIKNGQGAFYVFMKKNNLGKENWSSVSILPHMSRLFKRLMFNKLMITWHWGRLSLFLTTFRKNQNTHYCLLAMLKKRGYELNKWKILRVIVMDL